MPSGEGSIQALVFRRRDNPELYNLTCQFRKRLFVDLLGWSLSTSNDSEIDEYDQDHTVYAVLISANTILGAFRAIRTDHDYLARAIFPDLATTRPYPSRPDYWEISRFGVQPGQDSREIASSLYALMFQFALVRRIKALVAVTDLFHERQLRRRGIKTRRYGMPQTIRSSESARSFAVVAGEIPVQAQEEISLDDLLSSLNGVLINDKTLVFGRSRIQA